MADVRTKANRPIIFPESLALLASMVYYVSWKRTFGVDIAFLLAIRCSVSDQNEAEMRR